MFIRNEKNGDMVVYYEEESKPAAFTLKTNKVYARDEETAKRIKAHFPAEANVDWLDGWERTYPTVLANAKKGERFRAVRFEGESSPLCLINGEAYDMVGEEKMDGLWRVIDETWEDYIFSACFFSEIEGKGFFE